MHINTVQTCVVHRQILDYEGFLTSWPCRMQATRNTPKPSPQEAQAQLLPRSSAVVRASITPISCQGCGTGLVHGWDRIKNVHCYSFLGLSTHKNVKC